MVMKYSYFQHTECSTQQADELVAQYQRRGVNVERSLNTDHITWTVSARLPEDNKPPRVDRRWQSRMWGENG